MLGHFCVSDILPEKAICPKSCPQNLVLFTVTFAVWGLVGECRGRRGVRLAGQQLLTDVIYVFISVIHRLSLSLVGLPLPAEMQLSFGMGMHMLFAPMLLV